jgi:glycosyltransferase involved in cell wall biosynthesis
MSDVNPLVSIIIPCYNYGRYVGQAIESALAQTYRPKEIIVVNDGSTDNTIEVVTQYPVTLINQSNQGPAQAFNTGIHASQGDFVIILSADDLLHPLFLERTVPVLLTRLEIAFVYTHGLTFGEDRAIVLAQGHTLGVLKWGNTLIATNLMRKSVYEAIGGFDAQLGYSEDWDFYLTLAEHGYQGALVPEALVFIRTHVHSLRNRTRQDVTQRAIQRVWQRHPRIFTPSFTLRWRVQWSLQNGIHKLIMRVRATNPCLYELCRHWLGFLRPRALGLERMRLEDCINIVPPFPPGVHGPWEEVLCL